MGINKITTVLVDVDGTLASSQILYFRSGDVARTFSTYDGEGVALLKQHGIRVALVTQSKAAEIHYRADWLNIECYSGVYDKASFLEQFTEDECLELDEVCFMGNDLNDLGALKLCGFPVAPHNATFVVWKYCVDNGFVTDSDGGDGALRELADRLIELDFQPFIHPPFP